MIARPILAALDWAAVRLMAFALRHGKDPAELQGLVMTAYRRKTRFEAEAEAAGKLARAQARNNRLALARATRGLTR